MQKSNSRKGWSIGKLAHASGRLLRDNAGNTLAIVAAALIPITAMIGSGIDISRAYMAKNRLQSACDAASLAARRVMQNDTLTSTVTDTGRQFFNFNFPQGLYDTAAFEPAVTRPGPGLVHIAAGTTIPTTIMSLFGFESLPLSVNCEASLNFVNTDIALVLDVTLSMNDPVGGQSKIQSLRDAVMVLYDELAPVQTQLRSQGLRLRYGIVPYSSTVNVGRLVAAEDANYIRSSTPYQSRVANYQTTPTYQATDTAILTALPGLLVNPGTQRFRDSGGTERQISNANCANFGSNTSFSQTGTSPVGGNFTSTGVNNDSDIYVPDGTTTPQASAPAQPTNYIRYTFTRQTASWGNNNPANRVCDRTVTVSRRTYEARYNFIDWSYRQATLDTSTFKTLGGTIDLAQTAPSYLLNAGGTYNLQQLAAASSSTNPLTVNWNGCIEERDTVPTITASSGLTIPTNAFDLDINRIPDSDATRWRPMLKDAIYQRTAGSTTATSGNTLAADPGWWACPTEARLLAEWERTPMLNYVNSLTPVGGTYHDIGMIWGARVISTSGIFADGCDEFNGMPCNRHLIFMTDGQQTAYCSDTYTAWGLERNDMRVTGAGTCPDQLARHEQRFRMICNATRNLNVSVWVVAFATTLNTTLQNCASNTNQAFATTSPATLSAAFRSIGNQIGALRLTQ